MAVHRGFPSVQPRPPEPDILRLLQLENPCMMKIMEDSRGDTSPIVDGHGKLPSGLRFAFAGERKRLHRPLDPCPLVGQVNEIRGLELAHQLEWDPCHLVWRVNEISRRPSETRG